MDFRAGLEEATAPALRGSATGSAYALIVGALDLSAFSAGERQRLRRARSRTLVRKALGFSRGHSRGTAGAAIRAHKRSEVPAVETGDAAWALEMTEAVKRSIPA